MRTNKLDCKRWHSSGRVNINTYELRLVFRVGYSVNEAYCILYFDTLKEDIRRTYSLFDSLFVAAAEN